MRAAVDEGLGRLKASIQNKSVEISNELYVFFRKLIFIHNI